MISTVNEEILLDSPHMFNQLFQSDEEDILALKNQIQKLKDIPTTSIFYLQPKFIRKLDHLYKYLNDLHTQKSPKIHQHLGLDLANSLIVNDTRKMLVRLLNAGENLPQCKKIILNYAKHFRSYCTDVVTARIYGGPWDIVNDIVNAGIELGLYELDIIELDNEIERLEKLPIEKNLPHEEFVNAIKNLRIELLQGIKKQSGDQSWAWQTAPSFLSKEKILSSEAIQLTLKTANTLKQLSYTSEHQKRDTEIINKYIDEFKQMCAETPYYKNFWQGVSIVALAGLGFVGGLAVGIYAGLLCGGIGAIFTIPWGLYTGIECGIDFGKKKYGLPKHSSLSSLLFFKPPQLINLAKTTGEKAATFLNVINNLQFFPNADKILAPNKTNKSDETLLKRIK